MNLAKFLREWADDHNLYMDYKGQRKAEWCLYIIIAIFFLIGFPLGYCKEMLSISIYTVLIGTVVAAVVVLPPWPCYRRNPLNWQKELDSSTSVKVQKDKKCM
ncbi:unnamed protein product [Dicrocoelium dendriticum]|nr:unnamed protein product [Dicrocoelium dendriticum]